MSSNSLDSGSPAASNGLMMLIARIMMGHIFIVAGIRKAMYYEPTMNYIASKLPMADVLTPLTIIFEIGVGVLLVLGWRTRMIAWAMGIFCIVAAIIFHPFWVETEMGKMVPQLNNFMKNVAMAGGYLLFTMFGPGPISADKR